MSEFEKWSADTWVIKPLHEIIAEYNALHTAWQESQAELERIGKINNSMCDAIAFDELKPEVRARWERVAAVPISVPFSDAQIEAMAKAAFCEIGYEVGWTHADKQIWHNAIRAALAAGGLEPCAVPEYKPEDVALRPERASDDELARAGWEAWRESQVQQSLNYLDEWEKLKDSDRVSEVAMVRAVRARVEAPLLAEIQEHRRHVGTLMAREAALKARVAELEALYGLETAIALKTERDTLRAELEAARAERDALRSPDEETLQIASVLENAIHEYVGQVDAGEVATTRSECVEIALFIRDALINARMLSELAALRQPVDADAWKTPLVLESKIDGLQELILVTGGIFHDKMAQIQVKEHPSEHSAKCFNLSASDAARVAAHLASYATAHGCPVALPAPETRPVKVRWDVTPDDIDKKFFYRDTIQEDTHVLMDYLAAHAVIDVPAGVPSSYELDRIGKAAVESWSPTDEKPKMERYATAIRNAVLASLPTPHEPTAAEVEALARVLREAYDKTFGYSPIDSEPSEGYKSEARAAFAHFPTRSNAEMQICINRKNKRIDALKACVKKWKAKAEAVADNPFWQRCCSECCKIVGIEGASSLVETVQYMKDVNAELAAENRRLAAPIASADTLEQLAEIGWVAYQSSFYSDSKSNWPVAWAAMGDELKKASADCAAAILRAAKPRVDVDWAALLNKRNQLTSRKHTDSKEDYQEIIDWLNASIVYCVQLPAPAATHTGPTRAEAEAKWKEMREREGTYWEDWKDAWNWLLPQLPDERAEMPSARDLTIMIRESANKANCPYSSIHGAADLIAPELLTALRPWLRTPTGWELDVTEQAIRNAWLDGEHVGNTWDAARKVLDLCRSRIRPTFGPCKECETAKSRYNQLAEQVNRARAALEGSE